LTADGLVVPSRVEQAIVNYRLESDTTGDFLSETLIESDGKRIQTSAIYKKYSAWSKENGYRPLNIKDFIRELRRRYDIRRDGKRGNEVLGVDFA